MKFGLRFVIFFTLATGTGIGLYFMEMKARKGIQLKVERKAELRNDGIDVPDSMLEFRSLVDARDVKDHSGSYLRLRMEECCDDFREFHRSYSFSETLIETYPNEIREAATSALEDGSFETVVDAAWALNKLGDKSGIRKVVQRFEADREKDRKSYFHLFEFLTEERVADLDPTTIDHIKRIANSDSRSAHSAAELLFKCDFDKEPLHQLLSENKVSTSTLEWLVRNDPSKRVASAVGKWLETDPSFSYESNDLFTAVLELPLDDVAFKSVREKIEILIGESYLDLKYDDDRAECLRMLNPNATTASIPVIEKLISNSDLENFNASLLTVLHRLGETKSTKQHFLQVWDRYRGDFESWRGSHLKRELLLIAPPILGPEEAVKLCIESESGISLAEFVENSRDKDAIERLKTDSATLEAARTRAIEYLKSSTTGSSSHFIGNWFNRELSRQKAVDWINEKLNPTTPLTVDRVLNNERYSVDHSLWMTWSRFDHRVNDIQTFLIVALAHSGRGHLAHWEYTHPELICDSIEEYADVDRLNDFDVGAHFDDGDYPQKHSIVVNDRVYQFRISEGPNGSDERYDVGALVDIMNTIAIRQRLRRRFFIYETPERGYCLVMFLSPEEASNISDTFGISPDRGTSFYLEN